MMNVVNAMGTMRVLGAEDLLEHVLPHQWAMKVGPITMSNHIFMMVLAATLVFLFFSYVGMRARTHLVPTGVHNFAESILSFMRTEVIRPALGENADRFTPFIWTVFFFILFCNLLGLIPVDDVLELATGGKIKHIWGTATANLMVTAGLAIVAFITVHLSGLIQAVRVKMDPSLAPHHGGSDHAQPHGHGQQFGLEGIEDERDVVLDHHRGDGHDHDHGMHHSEEFHGQPFPVAVVTGFGTYIWNFAPHPVIGWGPLNIGMWFFLLLLGSCWVSDKAVFALYSFVCQYVGGAFGACCVGDDDSIWGVLGGDGWCKSCCDSWLHGVEHVGTVCRLSSGIHLRVFDDLVHCFGDCSGALIAV